MELMSSTEEGGRDTQRTLHHQDGAQVPSVLLRVSKVVFSINSYVHLCKTLFSWH